MSSTRPHRNAMPASTTPEAAPPTVSTAIMSRYQTLRRLLIKTSYTSPFPPALFLTTAPPALTLPILAHVLLAYSAALTGWLLDGGVMLSSGSVLSLGGVWTVLHGMFGYRPALTQQQFSSERGYVERKLQLLCDVLQMCVVKAEELEREKGGGGGIGGTASKAGVPRVAVLVKEQRRSAGAQQHHQQEEKQQQHRRQPSVVNTQRRQEKREEHKEERYMDQENEEEEDSDSPQPRQNQHVSFTHDDSSQPLSPSHLSPLSAHSLRSTRHLSPPSHSQSQPRSPHLNTTSGTDPLVALHQQLHRISHRTNQLSHSHNHNQQPSTTAVNHTTNQSHDHPSSVIQQLTSRLQSLETTIRDELSDLRKETHELRQRLAAVEQRQWDGQQQSDARGAAGKQKAVEEEEERKEEREEETTVVVGGAGGGVEERVTSGRSDVEAGGGGGGRGGGEGSISVLPSDMSEFLTRMNDRLSSTAKLLESSRQARGRLSDSA